ncbi:MAG: phosphohistidine phosphatase SixA [Acidobacteria bacterium]|nr:phosphohistidine phosphatase SixA [Acidobacteriota bacterium]
MKPPAGPTSVELYLVRHAVAAARGPDYPDDAERPLTADGVARFRRAVAGLRETGVQLDLVLTSPYARARDTAELLVAGLRPKPKSAIVEALAPGSRPVDVVAAVARYSGSGRGASRLALVGHEPGLGELAARLLGAKGAFEFKKGGVCRIDLDRAMPAGLGTLRWFLTPRLLRGLAP